MTSTAERLQHRYLELLKGALLNEYALEAEAAYFLARNIMDGQAELDELAFLDMRHRMPAYFGRILEARLTGRYFDKKNRNVGFSHTMIGRDRLDNLENCVTTALDENIPGDLIECGVWRGGAGIFMRSVLAAYGITDRVVWMADSFVGLPKPTSPRDTLDLSAERRPELAVSLERVRAHFDLYGLLDDQVRFLKGWFKDTLTHAPIERLAVLRVDGDLYESTMDVFVALYDRVSPGGFVIVDDYHCLPCCAEAVDDFRRDRGITDTIQKIDWTGVYWRKSA